MSAPRPWIGEPDAPTTFTHARARMELGHVRFSNCTCWMISCGPAACAASERSAAASAAQDTFQCFVTDYLLPLLADGAAFELELDVSELDDVVVDEVV